MCKHFNTPFRVRLFAPSGFFWGFLGELRMPCSPQAVPVLCLLVWQSCRFGIEDNLLQSCFCYEVLPKFRLTLLCNRREIVD